MRSGLTLVLAILFFPAGLAAAEARPERVADTAGLAAALKRAKPGTRIVLAPGTYVRAVAGNLVGTAEQPITIEAEDPKRPPVFEGGKVGLLISKCAHLTLRHLIVRNTLYGGLNVDDGGDLADPSHHLVLEDLTFADIGLTGNNDAIKLSGVSDVVVRRCSVRGWGGSGIDMVGCHRGLVEGCTFTGKAGATQNSGVQIKGGSTDVVVRNCTFANLGARGVNIGGSTDRRYFRPPGAKHEAKGVVVEGCRFVGGDAPVCFAGADGGVVRYNTFYAPRRWVVRILQDNVGPGMVPCANGRFEHNVVVYAAGTLRRAVNSSDGTRPETFAFANNVWYAHDDPARSKPALPVAEQGGVYGVNPNLRAPEDGDLSTPRTGPTAGAGADSLPPRAK